MNLSQQFVFLMDFLCLEPENANDVPMGMIMVHRFWVASRGNRVTSITSSFSSELRSDLEN